jgi:hypothetical protein
MTTRESPQKLEIGDANLGGAQQSGDHPPVLGDVVGRVTEGLRFEHQEVALSVLEREAVGSLVDTPAVSTVETERGLHETAFVIVTSPPRMWLDDLRGGSV